MSQYPKLGSKPIKRIVLLRALQLGDLMCAVPALRALRSAFPEAKVSLVGLPWSRSFVERFHHYLDEWIEFPGYPGFIEQTPQISRIPAFLEKVQGRHFDLAIQMHGSGSISNPLTTLFGAELSAGYYLPGQYCPAKERFLAYPISDSEVMRHLRLMEFLGIPQQGTYLEFPLFQKDWMELDKLQNDYHLQLDHFAVLHPGARAAARRWPPDWFATVGEGLVERGMQVVITGSEQEVEITRSVEKLMKVPVINLAGKTSLGGVGALLSKTRLLVCNDTGVSHVAAALNVPSVVLFTASDPDRWAPLDQELHRQVAWASAASPSIVLDEVDKLLDKDIPIEHPEVFQSIPTGEDLA